MKHLFTALFIFLSLSAFGQWDIVLDPIETETIQPSLYELQTGNWTPKFHETEEYKDYIREHAARKVVVYVHDTGAKYNNKYLYKSGKNILGKVYTGEQPEDGHGHSTHVAGCIAAYSPDFPLGVAGSIADYIWIIPHKVLTNTGTGSFSWVTESMQDAFEDGKKYQEAGFFVIHNLSLGGSTHYQPLEDVIVKAREAGQLVFIAAGNTGNFPVQFPGRSKGANAVAAIDQMGNRASFSSWGNEIYMSAGGVSVLSTMPNDQLAKLSGTSMATPTLAGLAAIVACTNPKATANQVENFLVHYATDIKPDGWDNKTGYGTVKYSNYVGQNAENEPDTPLKDPVDEPDEPNPDYPTRPERYIEFRLPTYTAIWKTVSGTQFEKVELEIKVGIKSKYLDEACYDLVKDQFDWFFCANGQCGRAFVLQDIHGFKDAGYYAGFFAELLINRREKLIPLEDIKIMEIEVIDEDGRAAYHKRQSGEKLATKTAMWGLRALKPYTFKYQAYK